MANGEKLLNQELDNVKDGVLKGEVIFKLYDTYGFPKEMTIESAEDRGIKCDLDGFNACMQRQKEMARNARDDEQSMHSQSTDLLELNTPFEFTGYTKTKDNAKVLALFKNGKRVDLIEDEGDVVFDHSCFYATSGGQIADTGSITNENTKALVKDVYKAPNGEFLHHVVLENGQIRVDDEFELAINEAERLMIKANHSSLHLLQAALKKVLGNHIAQAGSYVCKDYARFDFNHFEKISDEDLRKVEALVNEWICLELPVTTEVLSVEEAKKTDAIALFDEKYGDYVRVVSMGLVSKEFCGGTHVDNTSKLGSFKIVSEESVGSGIRRIEVTTKLKAYDYALEKENKLNSLKDELKLKNIDQIFDKVVNLKNELALANQANNKLKERVMNLDADAYVNMAKEAKGFKYLIITAKNMDYNLKDFAALIRNKLDGGLVYIINETSDKYSFVAALGKKALDAGFMANKLVNEGASLANGKGGGKPDLAQAGGANNGQIEAICKHIEETILK